MPTFYEQLPDVRVFYTDVLNSSGTIILPAEFLREIDENTEPLIVETLRRIHAMSKCINDISGCGPDEFCIKCMSAAALTDVEQYDLIVRTKGSIRVFINGRLEGVESEPA